MILSLAAVIALSSPDYLTLTAQWRKDYEQSLLAEEGWLKLAGLTWLHPGKNTIGSGKTNAIVLPNGTPSEVGVLVFNDGKVHLQNASGAMVTVDGHSVTEADLTLDNHSNASKVQIGEVSFKIIKRGARTGVRVFDPHSQAMAIYHGLHWYPIDEKLRIQAKYTPYEKPKDLLITNVLGDTAPVRNPGFVTFQLDGKSCRLEAQDTGSGFFFNFHDLTSGKQTYGAGRFLDSEAPKDGYVTLDFNRASNPPCGYTEFATCPLPPRSNYLQVAIRAGEKKFHD